jgi:hypothetical protein
MGIDDEILFAPIFFGWVPLTWGIPEGGLNNEEVQKMRKILFLLLIFTVLIGSNQAFAAPSNWAVSEVESARENNLVPVNLLNDYQTQITREEFSEMAVMLYEALSGEIARNQSQNPFTDTSNPEVLKAYDLGIVKGFGDGTFRPDRTITREEIAALLFRTLEKVDSTITQGTYTIGFSDRAQISIWFRNEVGFMSKNGIINGIGSNTFAPKLETTREQAIALVVRLFDQYGRDEKLTAEEIGALSQSAVQIFTQYDNGDFGYGSGFFFAPGKIATNYHVIEGAQEITIEYDDGSSYEGDIEIAGFDSRLDLAALTIEDSDIKPFELGDSSKLIKGQKVYSISSPIGYRNILTEGMVSGVTNDEIQVTIPLSEGSSGGVLVDEFGKAVGVVFARMYGVETLGFAKPINSLKSMDTGENMSLEEFNSTEGILNPPINIKARQENAQEVSLSWDWMDADHFLIFKSVDGGESFQKVLTENGSEKWEYRSELIIPLGEYEEGTRIMFSVASVKDGVVSERSHSNYLSLFKGMSESEVFDDLILNLPSISAEGTLINFEGYDVQRTSDNRITRIYAYVNEDGFEKMLSADSAVIGGIATRLKSVSERYAELIQTDVELTVLYLGLYDEYPHFLEDNYINPDGIRRDQFIGLWEAEYPLVNVASNSEVYITWYGPYSF